MFKYYSFDKYSIENLDKMQLWLSHYEAFNDPFECWCIQKTGIPDQKKEWDRYDEVAKTWGFQSGNEISKSDLFEYCSEFDNEYNMRVTDYIDSARIACFCKDPDNLLMWSHYADGLRGFCIEFDKNKLLNNQDIYAEVHDVLYQKCPPVVDTMVYEVAKDQIWYHEMAIQEEKTSRKYIKDYKPDSLLPEYHKAILKARELIYELYRKMLCSKPVGWEYETEIRLIKHTNSIGKHGEAFEYSFSAIKNVIIGEKATKNNIKLLESILSKNNIDIPIKMAIRSKDKYAITLKLLT